MESTTFIVLDKRPYEETGLLLYGISPDFGRLSVLSRGAAKITSRQTPSADLFRELEISFEPGKTSDLGTARELSLLTDFGRIADDAQHYKFAGKIGNFLLHNSSYAMPLPFTYDCLRNIFLQLILPRETDGRWSLLECSVALKVVYLYENGLFPEAKNQRESDFFERLTSAAIEGTLLPQAGEEYYSRLNQWCNNLITYSGLTFFSGGKRK